MQNLMNEYIKIVKSNMNRYMKLLVENRYIKNLSDAFIDTYTEIRYYGLIEVKKGFTVKNKILAELRKKKEELLIENPEKEKNINLIYVFLDSCISLNETKKENLEEEINQILNLRKEYSFEQDDIEYGREIQQLYKESERQKSELLDLTTSDKFFVKYSNCRTTNLKKVKLKYNLKFPSIYSRDIIIKAFNTGIVGEDKLFVEYNIVTAQIIRDIQNGVYRKQYILEFAETLLEKNQKLLRLLEILNHSSIQDRAIINITHAALEKNREKVYELLRNGYQIALTLDSTFEVTESNIQRLSLFQYIIVQRDFEKYNEIEKYKLKNIIEV